MLNKHFFLSYFLLSFIFTIQAQNKDTEVFIDERDNSIYPLVEINGRTWFASDLKYISPNAYFQNMDSLKTRGNFYYREESLTVCPEGWQLTSKEDWVIFTLNLFNQITQDSPNHMDALEHFLFDNPHKFSAGLSIPLSFWDNTIHLNLKPAGRVQGGVFYSPKWNNYVDYWTTVPDKKHPYYHIHISPNLIAGHSHKHHLTPKSKKKRMFKVRCVQ